MRIAGLSGFDVDSTIEQLMKAERVKVDNKIKEQKMKEYEQEVWADVNKEVFDFWQEDVKKMKRPSTYLANEATILNGDMANVTATADATTGTYSLKVTQLAKSSYLNSGEIADTSIPSAGTITVGFGSKSADIEVEDGDTVNQVLAKINEKSKETGVTASYDSNLKRFFLSANTDGTDGEKITLTGDDAVLNELGFDSSRRSGSAAQVAKVEFNGEALEFDSNSIKVGGLNIDIKATTSESTDIIVKQDVDAVYENIKGFVNKYNELLVSLNTKLEAKSARSYKPLLDSEKQAMTDDEVKMWEKKIKDSMLRRDDTLEALTGTLKDMMGSSLGVDTSESDFNYLFEIGIETRDYKEGGVLHIIGDKDDKYTAGNENTLKAKIESDPQGVADLFTAIAKSMDEAIQDKMQTSSLSSAFTMYNDKQMTNELRDYKTEVAELEAKLVTIESNYYKEFSAMEAALNKLNSQGAWLQSQLG
ncbi:MAG: flagellar filament capping protein FliD [Clostridia bacterium]|jgi:flagellar hook-associated protein 2|nr:flagellar filament capping protein FliD [Clostridia bacterium]